MSSAADPFVVPTLPSAPAPRSTQHQRTKSSVLRSLIGHRRNNSDGTDLPPAALIPPDRPLCPQDRASVDIARGHHHLAPKMSLQALGELQNRQDQFQRSPERNRDRAQAPPSPTKTTFGSISLKLSGKESWKLPKSKDPASPTKPKKAKSATNLTALLTRPKSIKNLKQLLSDEDARSTKDKENRTPPSSVSNENTAPPPIYAQFSSQKYGGLDLPPPLGDSFGGPTGGGSGRANGKKPRPKSYQPYATGMESKPSFDESRGRSKQSADDVARKRMTWGKGESSKNERSKSSTNVKSEPFIDPKDIDKHLEAMLDRRNIPENQRYKMRSLSDTIKMEFIRQDWAETHGTLERPLTNGSVGSNNSSTGGASDRDDSKKKKHSRGISLTLGKGTSKAPPSTTKKQKPEMSLGRHFRSKSSENVPQDQASPATEGPSYGGFFAKVKGQQRPADFVAYLRKVQKPELVEVGKLHKLRLLLRNETVVWTEDFIRQGGMEEIVGLLHRIMAVEWREEHEDALLHENLLCLKALCTTALALQYLHSINATLFPALIHMIFDPEKKGPSEFTTRNIITSVLLTSIESASPKERLLRAKTVLGYLRDPQPKEDERPVEFVLGMQRARPYRVWNREVVSVTKEVFWIFLHNVNIIALPPADKTEGGIGTNGTQQPKQTNNQLDYMARFFPRERPPVPAAPYVGGVEWDATNYLASHLDLVNAIIACTGPTSEQRNELRAELRISGWERCMGGSLRLCKEKFYGAVHDALRTWVAAAVADGWDVRDVRYGPPAESRSSSPVKRPGGAKKMEDAPKLEMPKLDLGIDNASPVASRPNDFWLS